MTKKQVLKTITKYQHSLTAGEQSNWKAVKHELNNFAFDNMDKWWAKVIMDRLYQHEIKDVYDLNNMIQAMWITIFSALNTEC